MLVAIAIQVTNPILFIINRKVILNYLNTHLTFEIEALAFSGTQSLENLKGN